MDISSFSGSYWATVLIYIVLMLLPVWVGYRRRVSRMTMLIIMLIGGLVPVVGFIAALYIAFRADAQPVNSPSDIIQK